DRPLCASALDCQAGDVFRLRATRSSKSRPSAPNSSLPQCPAVAAAVWPRLRMATSSRASAGSNPLPAFGLDRCKAELGYQIRTDVRLTPPRARAGKLLGLT